MTKDDKRVFLAFCGTVAGLSSFGQLGRAGQRENDSICQRSDAITGHSLCNKANELERCKWVVVVVVGSMEGGAKSAGPRGMRSFRPTWLPAVAWVQYVLRTMVPYLAKPPLAVHGRAGSGGVDVLQMAQLLKRLVDHMVDPVPERTMLMALGEGQTGI